MKIKLISIFLAVAMMVVILPLSAFAEDAEDDAPLTIEDVDDYVSIMGMEEFYQNYDNSWKVIIGKPNGIGAEELYTFNFNDQLIKYESANGTVIRYEYNYTNDKLQKEYADLDNDNYCDSDEPWVNYYYDSDGKLLVISTRTINYILYAESEQLIDKVFFAGYPDTPIITYLYNSDYTLNTGIKYGDGLTVTYEYDDNNNVSAIKYNDVTVATYQYDENGKLSQINDLLSGKVKVYNENGYVETHQGVSVSLESIKLSNVSSQETYTYTYNSGADDGFSDTNEYTWLNLPSLENVTMPNDDVYKKTFDTREFYGYAPKTIVVTDSEGAEKFSCNITIDNKSVSKEYLQYDVYEKTASQAKNYYSSITYSDGTAYTFEYDDAGNVISMSDGTYTFTYEYDGFNRIIRDNDPVARITSLYTYGAYGNILEINQYPYTEYDPEDQIFHIDYAYSYSDGVWRDQLVSYDGNEITYDLYGNATTWNGNALTWQGKNLMSFGSISYTYDINGNLMTKTKPRSTDVDHFIYDDNNNLICIYTVDANGVASSPVYYHYDVNDEPIAFTYGDTTYYYIKDGRGIIHGFINSITNEVTKYYYDSWGKIWIPRGDTEAAEINKLRYKGYYYDVNNKIYFTDEGVYDPEVSRMLTPASSEYKKNVISEYNLYDYAQNDTFALYDQVDILSPTPTDYEDLVVNMEYTKYWNCTSIRYNVPLCSQGNKPICWAGCEAMTRGYAQGTAFNVDTAYTAALEIASAAEDPNETNPSNISNDVYSDTWNEATETATLNSVGLRQLYRWLNLYGPLYVGYRNIDGTADGAAHLTVVTGIDFDKGLVYVNNPWGWSGVQTYEQFLYSPIGECIIYEYDENDNIIGESGLSVAPTMVVTTFYSVNWEEQ